MTTNTPMNTQKKLSITTPSDTQIVMTRRFDAPLELVWKALTQPEYIRKWLFLPPGWTMTGCEQDIRVGGSFRWTWDGPDGQPAMVMHGTYREVVPLERLVRTETFEMGCGPAMGEQIATLAFKREGGGTTVTITCSYKSKEDRDGAIASGMEHGVGAGYDNLEAMLAAGSVR